MPGSRKMLDCRTMQMDPPCTLTLMGSEEEIMPVAVQHAVTRHGDQDTPELRRQLRALMSDVP